MNKTLGVVSIMLALVCALSSCCCSRSLGCIGGHSYNKEYVCTNCGDVAECTLETIAQDFADDILRQAEVNAGQMVGDFEIVILEREDTLRYIENYIFVEHLDKGKIVRGLFVKFDVTYGGEYVLLSAYYNFGLEFSEEVTDDIAVSYMGGDEIWMLEVVEGNKKIVFEYSVTE